MRDVPRTAAWIDIGINLTHASYDADRAAVIARARAAGVEAMVVTGADAPGSRAALALARSHAGILYATAGVHPHHSVTLDAEVIAMLRELIGEPGVVAVGECGLDYYRNYSPREVQRASFVRQLELAVETGKPVFLHQRDAHPDFIAILREHRSGLAGAVAHCFTGTEPELDACLELGLDIGITGWICDERRGLHLRELVARIPRGRLMLETDGPYLLPRDLRPVPHARRNEPAFLPHIGRVVAACRAESELDCARHTSETARRFFGLPNAASG